MRKFLMIATGVIEEHYSFGFTKKLSGDREFSMSFTYSPENCVSGPSLFVPGQSVEICMEQVGILAQFNW